MHLITILIESDFARLAIYALGASVVWHISFPLMNGFNKAGTAIFPCRLCFLWAFPFSGCICTSCRFYEIKIRQQRCKRKVLYGKSISNNTSINMRHIRNFQYEIVMGLCHTNTLLVKYKIKDTSFCD